MQIVLTTGLSAFILYFVATGLLTWSLKRRQGGEVRLIRLALGAGFLAVLLHAYVLYALMLTDVGIDLSLFRVASLLAWLASALVLLAALRRPVENLGVGVFPLAALSLLAVGFSPAQSQPLQSASAGLEWHILLSLFAYSVLTLAALQAMLLYIQNQHLHNKHPGGFIRALPPLQTMESMLFQIIGLGFALLSAALISGFVALEDMFAQHLVHKTVLSILAWIVFGILLWGRWQFGWRGRVAIRWALGGFLVLMVAYFGSKLVLELILAR